MSGGVVLALIAVYFLPTVIVVCRGKLHGGWGVLLVNLLLGWTILGWFTALIWACSGKTMAEQRTEEQRHRELMATLGRK